MPVTTLDDRTYYYSSTEMHNENSVSSADTRVYGPEDWRSKEGNTETTQNIYYGYDELSEYSDAARASIYRGLRQTNSRSLGSFAEYAD